MIFSILKVRKTNDEHSLIRKFLKQRLYLYCKNMIGNINRVQKSLDNFIYNFMYGLKNIVPKGTITQENFSILKKHSQEYRRGISFFAGHMHQMIKIYIDYYQLFQANLGEAIDQLQGSQGSNLLFYRETINLFKNLNKETRKFIEKASNNQKSIIEVSNLFMTDYNSLIKTFQEKGRNYQVSEQNVLQTCKKYFTHHKAMLGRIDAYKDSFVSAKLIYNNQQKVKLYNDCLVTYKKLEDLIKLIEVKVNELNQNKVQVADSYKVLQKQLCNFTTCFASRYVEQLRKFYEFLFESQSNKIQGFIDKLFYIQKIDINTIFQSQNNYRYQNYLNIPIDRKQCLIVPSFLLYKQKITEQGIILYKRMIVNYFNQITFQIQQRKKTNKKIFEFIQKYLKGLDKSFIDSVRQVLQSFQKMRKRIGQVFGSRWISFYKIIAAIFENSIQNAGRLMLRTAPKVSQIQICINSEANLLSQFLRQLKGFTQKCISKKIIKKCLNEKQFNTDDILPQQKTTSQEQVMQMSTFLSNLIMQYHSQNLRCTGRLKQSYVQFFNEVKQCMGQYLTFFNQIKQTYYKEEEYAKVYKLFQDQMTSSVIQGMKFFQTIQLSQLIQQTGKIYFDSQFNKIEGFKKLKKPKQLQNETSPPNGQLSQGTQNSSQLPSNATKTMQLQSSQSKIEATQNLNNIIGKQMFLADINSKNAEFLLKKITLEYNQKYVKSYSCSLSDRIILAGRLFITTHRICFYSKFNSRKIFFGQTFINIPKLDIKKLQKRSMSLFSDNAIAITTVNGQLIFRSFFSRDSTYDLLKKTFQVNNQQIFFEQQMEQGNSTDQKQVEFEDDMKEQSGKQRQQKILKSLKDFSYTNVSEEIFEFPGLTVVKFLKIFDLDQQVVINRTNFRSFLYYFKDLNEHKQITIDPWDPNPLEYLNIINLKQGSPQVYKRKVKALVPLPPSNIPFLPKSAPTTEEQTMFLINKDKVVIESTVTNTGVPYCEAFDVRIKKIIETAGENKDKVKVSTFVCTNFKQEIMVRSTIESKTISTITESIAKQSDEVRAYLRNLENKINKAGKKQTPEQKIKQLQQLVQQISGQSKKYKQQSKKYQGQIETLKQDMKNRGIIIIFLAIIIVVELIVLL